MRIINTVFLLLLFTFIFPVNAEEFTENNESENAIKINLLSDEITRADAFKFFADSYYTDIPKSYKYIDLKFLGLNKGEELYDSLQKLVYFDLIDNKEVKVNGIKNISANDFYKLSDKIFNIESFSYFSVGDDLKKRSAIRKDLSNIKSYLDTARVSISGIESKKADVKQKKGIFTDVYQSIVNNHYDSDNLDEAKMLESAIEGLAKGSKDKYTVYFPPTDSKNFYDSLNGEYEGIGAYVDMETPGVVKIVTPISGSPAEKSGLKGGDIITKVDENVVSKNNSLNEVISWIKGPAGSSVFLTIKRQKETLIIEVVREKIVLNDIEYGLLDKNTYLIEIKGFGERSSELFNLAIEDLNKYKRTNRLIIDLRNNGGGYLTEVSKILSHFVPKGESTAIVKYKSGTKGYYSEGYDDIDLSKYKLILLENSGTASASEIMIGTIKDYLPDTIIIGEKSYGKGSVQTIKSYIDGSSLKFTIAKWFTGKSETGIDGVGIEPDIELELDIEKFKNQNFDNQLERARTIN